MMNPLHALALSLVYLLTVFLLVQLTKPMAKGFSLKYTMLAHNFVLFAVSLYMGVEVLTCLRLSRSTAPWH
jgi:GNS1/SUR4 family